MQDIRAQYMFGASPKGLNSQLCTPSCRRKVSAIGCLLILLFLVASVSQAQVGASVGGTVTDNSGAVVPGATVTITNTSTGVSQQLTTGASGNYRAVNLPPAPYRITAAAQGFANAITDVTLFVGTDTQVNLALGVAGVAETVNVEASAALVEVTKSDPSSVTTDQEVADLPVLNRNFMVLAQTMPGAAPLQNLAATQIYQATKFGGVADQESSYTTIVDGGAIDNNTWGVPVINVSQDSIEEFKVFRDGFDAQYGNAMNAVVSIATKSGTDQFHGSGYYFGRDADLNARNALALTVPPYSLLRAGGTFGGPLFSKKLHFFGGFEYLKINQAAVVALAPSNPFAAEQNGNYPYSITEKMADVKIDYSFSSKNSAHVRWLYDNQNTPTGGPANSEATLTQIPANSAAIEDDWIISPSIVNTAEYTFLHVSIINLPTNYDVTLVFPDYSFGSFPYAPYTNLETDHAVSDTIFINTAKHAIKIGAGLEKSFYGYTNQAYARGVFTFTNDGPFNVNNPATWPVSFVQETPYNWYYREWLPSFFVQDDWRILPRLRLNLGLRYDFNTNLRDNSFWEGLLTNPAFAGISNFISNNRGNSYFNGLQPRLGFAWDITGAGKFVLRGGAGKYTTRNRQWWDVTGKAQTYGAAVDILNPQQLMNYPNITAVLNGQSLQSYVENGGKRAAGTVIPNNFVTPYALNFTAGFSWAVNAASALSVDYVHEHGVDEVGASDSNLPATGVVCGADGVTTNCNPRPVPQFSQFTILNNWGQSDFDALEISYRSRIKNVLDFLTVAYTYSRNVQNAANFYNTYYGTQRFRGEGGEYSVSPYDTPNNLSLSFLSRMLPGKIQLSGILRAISGGPLGPVAAGFDLDGDGNVSGDRPMGLPQFVGYGDVNAQLTLINAFRANPCAYVYFPNVPCTAKPQAPISASLLHPQPVIDLDARLSKVIAFTEKKHLELFFEAYNLTNSVTKYGGVTNLISPAFLIRSSALTARDLQWGTRFVF